MAWSIRASVTSIPIHGDMFISIRDVPEGNQIDSKKLKRILKGLSFEEIKKLLSKTQYSDFVSVGQKEKSA